MPDTIPSSQFDLVVSAAHRMLKPRGYAKSGARFRRGVEGNSVIIQFQKSAWNSADSLRFTVNFAIMSHRLAAEDCRDPAKIFDETKGHARMRIGKFRTTPGDLWWTLENPGDANTVISEFLPLLERGISYCEANASDHALGALWRRAQDPASNSRERHFCLSVGLKSLVPH